MNFFRTSLFLCVALLVTVSCSLFDAVEAEGERFEKSYETSSFRDIEFSSVGEIHLMQGNETTISVDTYESIHDAIDIDVRGNTLEIEFHRDTDFTRSDLVIYITVPNLEELEVNGSSTVIIGHFESENTMRFEIGGSGDISMQSAGDKLVAPAIEFEIRGSGEVNACIETESVEAEISGSGIIELEGTAKQQDIEISGSGHFRGFDCEGTHGDVVVSGSGTCEIAVSTWLKIKVSGSGEVVYDLDPELSYDLAGSGSVRRR